MHMAIASSKASSHSRTWCCTQATAKNGKLTKQALSSVLLHAQYTSLALHYGQHKLVGAYAMTLIDAGT